MPSFFSPAKINLFLKILGKRSDGYHELSSLFQTIDLGDTLHIELYDKDVLTCTDPLIPTDASNLILRAAQLFRKKIGIKVGIKVHLDKHVPIQAGLGGGSSNAATTLWAFNQLMGYPATWQQLQAWSAEIGSDIPFFFSVGTAYCTGRGERVYPLPNLLRSSSVQIVKPPLGLSTPAVYQKLRVSHLLENQQWQHDFNQCLSGTFDYVNELEKPAFKVEPSLENLKAFLLNCQFDRVIMTGSGSAFFCLGEGKISCQSDLLIFTTRFIHRDSFNWYQPLQ